MAPCSDDWLSRRSQDSSAKRSRQRQRVPRFSLHTPTRAGVDCMGHVVRSTTDADPTAIVLSVDGIGTFDHVHRAAMMSKLLEVSGLRALLPFVRASYVSPSRYSWDDDSGQRHEIRQHEGGEQGDPLMPLLFSLAIHNSLAEVKAQLAEGSGSSTIFWEPDCTREQGSSCMKAKFERGIAQECAQRGWDQDSWDPSGISRICRAVGAGAVGR